MEDSTGGWHPMYERIGPFYDSSGAAYRLGVDEAALAAGREEGTVLAMRTGSGEWLYPAWQFTVEGAVHKQLVPVLARFTDALRPIAAAAEQILRAGDPDA